MYEVSSGRVVGRAAAALLCAAVLLAGAFALPSPASAAVVPAPSALTVLAGDMVDVLAWTPPRTGVAASYRIESAPAESGPWTVVGKTTTPRYTDRLRTPALLYYRVVAIDRAGKASPPSLVVSNAQVAIESLVTATGATLRAANGALSLTLPAGTFSAPTRVRVTQPANAPAQRVGIAVTPAYDFYASAALAKPASVTMAYTIPVKHFQVAAGLAAAIELATFEAASSKWVPVPTTVDTAAGTLSAQMPHFSYWEGTIIQPHGTSPAKTSYCDGICHNLAVAPGSQTVLTTTDSQVCYNCHGSDGLSPTPAGATGANVQADVFACTGQTFDPVTQSRHPVPAPGTTAGLACTRCHDPHADPTASPNLLRAQDAVTGKAVASKAGLSPGNPFCWACHGTRKNASVDRAVAGYYTRTGDKKTAFQYTPHANGPQITRIFALPNDFGRGTLTGAEAPASGGLIPTEHENIALGKAYTSSPDQTGGWGTLTDGDMGNDPTWFGPDLGFGPGDEMTVQIDVDLGSISQVRGAKVSWPGWWGQQGVKSPDSLRIQTSVNGSDWTDAGTAALVYWSDMSGRDCSFSPRQAQYVRFIMSKVIGVEGAQEQYLSVSEIEVFQNALSGSFESASAELARDRFPSDPVLVSQDRPYVVSTPSVSGGGVTSDYMTQGWVGGEVGEVFTVDIDVDLGSPHAVQGAQIYEVVGWPQERPDTLQVMTSLDGVSWVDAGPTLGTLGEPMTAYDRVWFTRRSARYVRFRVAKIVGTPASGANWLSLTKVEAYGSPLSGYVDPATAEPAREGTATSSRIVWESQVSAGSTIIVETQVSLNQGATWGDWATATNGGPVPGVPLGTPLQDVAFKWRASLNRPTTGATVRLKAISFVFGTSHEWSATTWPDSSAPKGSCANCHSSHGGPYEGLTLADGNDLCVECHNSATPDLPSSYSFRDSTIYDASAHGELACIACHPAHGAAPDGAGSASLLPRDDGSVCLTCHSGATPVNGVDVAAAFAASSDPLAHHDAAPGAQSPTGTRLGCDDCHNPHVATTGQPLTDPDAPGTPMPASTSVPADSVCYFEGELDIPVIADTTLDESNPTYNYGGSTSVMVDATKRGLVRADVDALPPGIYVTSAELRVNAPDGDREGDVAVRVLSEPWPAVPGWSEGTGDGDPNDGAGVNGATWDERYDADFPLYDFWWNTIDASWGGYWDGLGQWWQVSGGGYENTWEWQGAPYGPYSTAAVGDVPAGESTVTMDVTTQIRARYSKASDTANPTDILLIADGAGSRLTFDSREGANAPYVHVHYYRTSVLIAATADTSIWSTSTDRNDGAATSLVANGDSRALLRFDVSSIPSNATITSARVVVFGSVPPDMLDSSFVLKPITTDWREGSGDDDPNPGADGATWNETRDGASWTTAGGDYGDAVGRSVTDTRRLGTEIRQWIDIVGKDGGYAAGIVDALRDPAVHGLGIVSTDGTELFFDSRESGRAPVLEVQYSLAEPEAGVDSIAFCTKCHDDGMPGGIGTYVWTNWWDVFDLRDNYQFTNSHGSRAAKGPASTPSHDATATLKAPYFYGMGPLQCTECHDPHGSKNVFHLKETINGVSGLSLKDPKGYSELDNQVAWCAACHDIRTHAWRGNHCIDCHSHSRNTGRRF